MLCTPQKSQRGSRGSFVEDEGKQLHTVPDVLKTCPVHGVTKIDPCDQREDKFHLVTGCLILRDARQRGYSYRVCIRVVLNTTGYYMTRSFLISHFSKSALLRDHSRKSKRVLLKIKIVSQRQSSYFWSRERPEKLAKQNYKKKIRNMKTWRERNDMTPNEVSLSSLWVAIQLGHATFSCAPTAALLRHVFSDK